MTLNQRRHTGSRNPAVPENATEEDCGEDSEELALHFNGRFGRFTDPFGCILPPQQSSRTRHEKKWLLLISIVLINHVSSSTTFNSSIHVISTVDRDNGLQVLLKAIAETL